MEDDEKSAKVSEMEMCAKGNAWDNAEAGEDGSADQQAAFMRELEEFHRDKSLDFKPPKFYGELLNCLKLWRAVVRLGGYELVTSSKLWRQVGESFRPPKTCTTVSWTFRIFYEKALLEYEKHKRQTGELQLPVSSSPSLEKDAAVISQQGGSGRARRDSAARAMQGWHANRVVVDKTVTSCSPGSAATRREKNLKSVGVGLVKHKSQQDIAEKAERVVKWSVVDVGLPADWVKINVRESKDCFEVYALLPGLLREEVRVQSDPEGRLVLTGQPEQADNPWGITPFQKVVSLPGRIDPLHTSAVVSLHGRLVVRLPFEHAPL